VARRGSSGKPWRCSPLLLVLLAGTWAPQLRAAGPIPAARTLTLGAALERAQRSNPELRTLDLELRALDARREQAGVRPNPELTLAPENVFGSGEFSGIGAGELTLSLSQVLERGGKRARRVAVVDAEMSVAEAERTARRVDLLAEVTREFIAIVACQERVATARSGVAIAARTLAAVEKRVAAAASPLAEGHRARVASIRARLAQQRAEQELAAAQRQLASRWGALEADFDIAGANLFALDELPDYAQFLGRLPDSAALVRFASEARLRDAQVRLEQARQRQDVAVAAGVRRLQASGDQALVLSFSMPLALGDRNAGAIREAQVRRAQLDAQQDAAGLRLQADLFALYRETGQVRREALALQGEVLPELEQALAQTEYAYQRGRYSYLELVDAQRALLEARQQAIDSAASYHTLVAEIERLTGAAVTDARR
jgi:cobalt-zinc-cadmium efflux system outer membrane protein